MFKFRAFSIVLPLLFVSILITYNANAQTFLPVGPQTNVPVGTVTGGGWTECYRDTYDIHIDADAVLADCPGDRLMLSCRQTGSDILTLLAQGNRSDVTFDTGDNNDVTHIANGVGWYFNFTGKDSWGFVRAGDSVAKNNCDTDESGANDERLCWHLNDFGGYRCGTTQGLNDSVDFERIVYMPGESPLLGDCCVEHEGTSCNDAQCADTICSRDSFCCDTNWDEVCAREALKSCSVCRDQVLQNIPTLSEWGLITAAAGLGLVGVFFAVRRRRAVAK